MTGVSVSMYVEVLSARPRLLYGAWDGTCMHQHPLYMFCALMSKQHDLITQNITRTFLQVFYDIACKWLGWALKNGSEELKERLRKGDTTVLVGAMHALMHNMACQLTFAGLYAENGARSNGEGCETGMFKNALGCSGH